MRDTINVNSTPLLHVSFWCKPRGIKSVLSVKYAPKIAICNTKPTMLMKLEIIDIKCTKIHRIYKYTGFTLNIRYH